MGLELSFWANPENAKKQREDQPDPEEQELPSNSHEQGEKACEYCGKFDKNFTKDVLDMHMYNKKK